MTSRLLLDTNVLIERERSAPRLAKIEAEWAISAMTLSELNLGLLLAKDLRSRQRRLAGLTSIADVVVLAFDETVARTHAELMAWGESKGNRPSIADAIIAATAATHGLTLVTFDRGFEPLAQFAGLELLLL